MTITGLQIMEEINSNKESTILDNKHSSFNLRMDSQKSLSTMIMKLFLSLQRQLMTPWLTRMLSAIVARRDTSHTKRQNTANSVPWHSVEVVGSNKESSLNH